MTIELLKQKWVIKDGTDIEITIEIDEFQGGHVMKIKKIGEDVLTFSLEYMMNMLV